MVAGAALVGLLSLKRPLEPLLVGIGIAGLVVSGIGIADLSGIYPSPGMAFVAVLLGFGFMLGGYGLASSLLMSMATRPKALTFEDDVPPGPDHKAVVLLTAMLEPEHYDPSAVASVLREWTDAGMPEPTIGVTPFLYAAQKARYRAVGGTSGAVRQARAVADRLYGLLDGDRFERVELVTGIGHDTLAQAALRNQRQGVTRIVVALADIAEPLEIRKARYELESMRPETHGISVSHTAPLWGSDLLAEMVADRVAASMFDSQTTGAVLVMRGQPEEREATNPEFDVHENAFANRVKMLLGERGLPESSVRLCWAEWRMPDVTESVRHLAALGCTRILVSPACFPFESIDTILDLSVAVRQARVKPHVHVTTLQPWGDDPAVVEALREEIERVASEKKPSP